MGLAELRRIIIDAIRAAKIAKDRGLGGPILPASAYLMKSPPVQMADDKARTELEAFIIGASNSALRTHRAVSESSDSLTATVVFTCHSSGHTSYHRQRQHLHAYASGIHGHPGTYALAGSFSIAAANARQPVSVSTMKGTFFTFSLISERI